MSNSQFQKVVHHTSIHDMQRGLQAEMHLLQERCRMGTLSRELFQSLIHRFQCLPLTTDEYGRATCHLKNAFRYMCSGERGAALYELRLMRNAMKEM